MLLDLLEPRSEVKEGLLATEVEHNDDPIGSLVICVSDCSVSFLAGSVPNLQLDCALVDLQGAESLYLSYFCKQLTKSTPIVVM